MENFEGNAYTLFKFMQCLEDILKYIDNFSSGHTILLDIIPSDSSALPKTSSRFDSPSDVKPDALQVERTQQFLITRRKQSPTNQAEKTITISVELKVEGGAQNIVESCSLCYQSDADFQNITDKAKLRDAICAHLNPVLRVFPILNVLVNHNTAIENCSLHPNVSRFCLRVSFKNTKKKSKKDVLLAVNTSDKLVTWVDDGVTNPKTQTWDLEHSDPGGGFSKNTLLLLSYVIGTINQ